MIAVVTGGTSGIGFEISKQFILRGDTVYAIYKSDDDKAENAKKQINNPNFFTKKLDITNEEKVMDFLSTLTHLDFLINCAGISIENSFENLKMEDIKQVMDVNLFGKMNCAKYALPLLKKSTCPRIINIASRFAQKPFIEGMMAYSCSEASIVMMTQVLALEYAKYGIKTNTVSPSLTLTPLTQSICTKEEIETISNKNPSKRLGKPEDVANIVLFLCSEKSDYINGENINVNGGILLI